MIICHSRRFILIRPRKVASSSVQAAFIPHLAPGDLVMRLDPQVDGIAAPCLASVGYVKRRWPLVLRQHSSLARLVAVLGHEVLDYRIITLVRNPWDKAVSEFFYDSRAEEIRRLPVDAQKAAFANWVRANTRLPLWRRLIYRMEGAERVSKLEQSALCTVKGQFRADHVIRYENLEAGLQQVGDALGLTLRLPGQMAKGGMRSEASRDWRGFYTEETKALVAAACRKDIERFGYGFEASSPVAGKPAMPRI